MQANAQAAPSLSLLQDSLINLSANQQLEIIEAKLQELENNRIKLLIYSYDLIWKNKVIRKAEQMWVTVYTIHLQEAVLEKKIKK